MSLKSAANSPVEVKNVFKDFVIPHTRKYTIKSKFTSAFGKEGKRINKGERRPALKGISFDVKKGEFFGIVGRNGSGKSTLLKMIAGIYQPSAGKISVEGKLVPFIELGVGFNPELSGKENVYLNGAILGFSKHEIDARYEKIVQFAELEEFMTEKLKNYSSGMQVRLAFSCATQAQADVLLVDEVLAVGDADFQRKCFSYFKKLKKDNKTVIFVSHDMNAVREYCDRAVLIENGNIISEGKSEKVATMYSKLFLGEDDHEEVEQTGKRWGDNNISIDSITTSKKLYGVGDTLKIKQKITAHVDVSDPIAGFRIKSSTGEALLGTNSRIKKQDLPPMKSGETVVVNWELDNLLSDGKYYIDPAVVYGGSGTKIADWWEDAARFNVKKVEQVPYQINPDISVSFTKLKKR